MNYKLVESINFLTLSKQMKEQLMQYNIFSRLINLDIV